LNVNGDEKKQHGKITGREGELAPAVSFSLKSKNKEAKQREQAHLPDL
jgi:hypothetical protein